MLDGLLADRTERGLAAPAIVEQNIETDEDLHRRYLLTIPVVAFGDRELELATSQVELRAFLADALDTYPEPAS
jgi:hypothetical protein